MAVAVATSSTISITTTTIIMPGFELRKSVHELADKLRQDIREIAGVSDHVDTGKRTAADGHQRGSSPKYPDRRRESHAGRSFLDTRRMQPRLARASAISAATVYVWLFAAHPAALAGFAVAVFDLVIGLGAAAALAREAIMHAGRRKRRRGRGDDAIPAPSWIETTGAYMWARREFQERLRLAALGVGVAGSPATRARRYLNFLFASAPAMVLGAGLASATVHPYLIFLAVAPGAIIAVPFLSLKIKKAERGEVDDELPFLLIIAEMFALVEKPLFQALEALAKSDLLPKMRREAEIVRRDVSAFGYTPEQAIDSLAAGHPNPELRLLLRGYLASVSLGHSAAQYFQVKAETYLARLESRYERFRENAGTAGEVVLIALMIVPVTGLMYGASGVSDFVLAGTIPLIALGVFFMLDRAQIKGPQVASGHRPQLLPAAAGACTAMVALALFQAEPLIALFASVAAFAFPHGLATRRGIKREDRLLDELAEFIREVAEGMKTGLDVVSAVRHIEADRFGALRPAVRRIKSGLARGGTLDVISAQERGGFYVRYAMFVMSALAASGAASYAMLDRLAEYLGRMREQSARVKKSVAVYGFLVVASPLFMMFTMHAMESISLFADAGGDSVPDELGALISVQLSADSLTVQLTYFFTTLCAGALGGKITSQTIRDTVPLGVACVIALVSPAALDMLWPIGSSLP